MRNLLEHFAYTITGNLNSLIKNHDNCLFVDNFFGAFDIRSRDIDGVKAVRKYNFGKNIPSRWKRRIFNGINAGEELIIDLPDSIYNIKRYENFECKDGYLDSSYDVNDQIEILRTFFMLNTFGGEENHEFINGFLNSPAFMDFIELQERKGIADRRTIKKIDDVIKGVMQEYCSDMKIPRNLKRSNEVYITLARKSHAINQSAQVVLGIFDWNNRVIGVESITDSRGMYQFYLKFKHEKDIDSRMILALPLLDYLFSIEAGASLANMDSLFQKRLENIKLKLYKNKVDYSENESELKIVYKDIQNNIHSISYFIEGDEIQVEGE